MQKYKIDSISSYFNILEKNNISDYIYRGQNEPYFSIQASGYRPYMGGWNSDMIYDMQHIHSSFYNKVIGQLSIDEKKHFLAFCQHHGIPTNLIDVSYSPLVALFFACEGKSEIKFTLSEFIGKNSIDDFEKDTPYHSIFMHNLINKAKKPFYSPYAQVYMINKERLVDITDLIIELKDKNLFEELLTDEVLALKLLNLVKKHFRNINITKLHEWLTNIMHTYVNLCEDDMFDEWDGKLYILFKSLLEEKQNNSPYKDIIKILETSCYKSFLYKRIFKSDLSIESMDKDELASIYIAIMIEILDTLKMCPRKTNVKLDIYFTYQPPQLFKRISSQQSFFIYQSALYTNDGVYDYCELNVQSINPDILIEIDNYKDILNNLSVMGIDNGSIYGDIDSIAKSVLLNSGKLLKV